MEGSSSRRWRQGWDQAVQGRPWELSGTNAPLLPPCHSLHPFPACPTADREAPLPGGRTTNRASPPPLSSAYSGPFSSNPFQTYLACGDTWGSCSRPRPGRALELGRLPTLGEVARLLHSWGPLFPDRLMKTSQRSGSPVSGPLQTSKAVGLQPARQPGATQPALRSRSRDKSAHRVNPISALLPVKFKHFTTIMKLGQSRVPPGQKPALLQG